MDYKDYRDLMLAYLIIIPILMALLSGYKGRIEYISIYLLISILFSIIWGTVKITEAIDKIKIK